MIQLPNSPKILSSDNNMATFEISPLYPGYGITLGNSLRRVLVSSLEGAAITSVKIKGIDHEFSPMKGVMEDVIDIILNLKKIRVKSHSNEPVIITLESKGRGDVTAASIKSTSDVEIINKDEHICTVTDDKINVEMELTVERGVGYVPVELRGKEKLSVGKIAIDGIFTPVKNVNFTVDNIRVGQRTDFNRVLLDIETDGTISPEDALKSACDILLEHFTIVKSIGTESMASGIDHRELEKELEAMKEEIKLEGMDPESEDAPKRKRKSSK